MKYKTRKNLAALALGTGIIATTTLENSCATALGSALLGGYIGASIADSIFPSYSNNPQTSFFTCNEWIDKNNDGMISNYEFVGVKKIFRANEKITVVAIIQNPTSKGAIFQTKVLNGSGKEIYLGRDKALSFEESVMSNTFNPLEIYNLGGQGDYTAYFYLNSNLIGITKFSVVN